MRKLAKIIPVILGMLLAITLCFSKENDVAGSKDHPLLTRMPDFYIYQYKEQEFDAYNYFKGEEGKSLPVEGHIYTIRYYVQPGAKVPSQEAIMRNYINAITKIGGTLLYKDYMNAFLKVKTKDGTTWVQVKPGGGGKEYYLIIIEEQGMEQDVVADAAAMAKGIDATGHATIYGIYFDFNKSDIKPESDPALKEIAKLLQGNSSLRVFIVGHTDNVGAFDYNMKLSQARADAVMKKLVSDYGIDAARLQAQGVGPLAPVSSNDTDEGKGLNRRVELVKQ